MVPTALQQVAKVCQNAGKCSRLESKLSANTTSLLLFVNSRGFFLCFDALGKKSKAAKHNEKLLKNSRTPF